LNEHRTAGQEAASDNEPIIIKRYASRKLYDAGAKEYVTLEDIARYIRKGREVKIIDKKTGEDLTRQYMVQIIADFESQGEGEGALPLDVLTDLVRHYQDQASAMTPAFLTQMFENFKEQQQKVMEEIGTMRENVFDPQSAMDAMKDWQSKQAEFFSRAWQGWNAQDAPAPPEDTGKPAATSAPEAPNPAATDENDAKSRKIAEMEAHLKLLQDQLDKLR
jgi:polyhydroxyalkanoate synthesis repressor PhaR